MSILPLALAIGTTEIRVVAGIMAVVVLFVIVWRRKHKAAQ